MIGETDSDDIQNYLDNCFIESSEDAEGCENDVDDCLGKKFYDKWRE